VLGIGIVKGVNTVDVSVLKRIFLAWIFTPVVACSVALLISYASRLRYIPL
jgi:phosphate/sulfate permease